MRVSFVGRVRLLVGCHVYGGLLRSVLAQQVEPRTLHQCPEVFSAQSRVPIVLLGSIASTSLYSRC